MPRTLFTDFRILNCTGAEPYLGEVLVMSEAEVAAAAEVVHAHGKQMSAHCRSADSVKLAVRHGVKVIYHANFADLSIQKYCLIATTCSPS